MKFNFEKTRPNILLFIYYFTGISWKTVVFYKEPMKVYGLLTEPGENSTTFTVFGTEATKKGIDWIIVNVDLSSVFDRKCTESDYKRWSPHDNTRYGFI